MTDGFEVPGATATVLLPAVVARVTALADRLGVPHAEVFDTGRLSVASGVPETRGEGPAERPSAGEPDLQARFLQRLDLLRRTRLKPNGRKYTQQEIADGAGMSAPAGGRPHQRRPAPHHGALRRHPALLPGARRIPHGRGSRGPRGRPADAPNRSFSNSSPTVSARRPKAAHDPLERLLQDHGVRGIAWRAAQLPTDQHRDKVAEWLDMLLESVKRPES